MSAGACGRLLEPEAVVSHERLGQECVRVEPVELDLTRRCARASIP